jgi:uncharacterized protein (PEP-CTERM system associated)
VWNVRAYRNVVSFPEQLGHFASTTDVPGLLDQLFQSLVPDPLLRQQYVDQFLRDRALPASLSSALLLFSHQVYLEEKQTASVALVGARNTIVFSLYHVRNDPIAGVDPTVLAAFTGSFSDVQRGASAIWTHKLTPVSTLAVDLGAARAEGINAQTGNTRQGHVRAVWSRRLSPRTTAYAGARYQRLHSDVTSNYSERAVFVGIGHFFQ